MRRVRYSVAMSLDGYIAGPNGEYDWIIMDPDIDFESIYREFDTILLGRKTYEMTRQQPGPAMPGVQSFVFSRTLQQEDCPEVTVSKDPAATITDLKSKSGKDMWLFGGGQMFSSLLQLRLVDSVEVAVIPVLLGGGIPLLPDAVGPAKLKLIENNTLEKTGTVTLSYAIEP